MNSGAQRIVYAALVTLAASYGVIRLGGGDPDFNLSLWFLGAAGITFAVAPGTIATLTGLQRLAVWAALLVVAYVAFQLLPLPLSLLRFVSPTRAEVSDSLSLVTVPPAYAPLTISAGKTWLHLSRLAGCVLTFVIIRQAVESRTRSPWPLILPLIALGGFESIAAVYQYWSGRVVMGTYLNQNHFAGLLEMTFPFALMMTVARFRMELDARSLPRVLTLSILGGMTAAMFAGVVLSLSRAGFVSMLCGIAVMGFVALFPRRSAWQRTRLAAAALAIAIVTIVAAPTDALISGFGELTSNAVLDGRWPIAMDTLRMIAEYPVFGIGFGTYYPGLLAYQSASLDMAWVTAHNDVLQFLAELGVIGFVLVAAVVCTAVSCAIHSAIKHPGSDRGYVGLACVGSLTAIIAHSLADFNMYIPANALVFMVVAGFAIGNHSAALQAPRILKGGKDIPLRLAVLAVGAWLFTYSAASGVVFLKGLNVDVRAEERLCRVGICDLYGAIANLRAQHAGSAFEVNPTEFERLLVRDPAGPYNWINLGESLEAHGNLTTARASFARAIDLGPRVPFFLMRAAEFHFRQREHRQGLELMARSIAANVAFQSQAFTSYEQHAIPVHDVLAFGLGSRRATEDYFQKLLRDGDLDRASVAWSWLRERSWLSDHVAADYVNDLVRLRQTEAAASVWGKFLRESGRPGLVEGSVFNGGFEGDLTNCVLDWRLLKRPGVQVSLDDSVAFKGRRSAKLEFDGTENVSSIGLVQSVFLSPGRYRLEAVVRTENLTTDQGIAVGFTARTVRPITDARVGTTGWTSVSEEFEVTRADGELQLAPVRSRSFRFDNKIKGTAWIDDIRITQVSSARHE